MIKTTIAKIAAVSFLLVLEGATTFGIAQMPANGENRLSTDNSEQLFFDASQPVGSPETGYLHLGGRSTDGHDLELNSQYVTLDGKPWLPVMGEFHFSRYPRDQWEDEIAKMQAAGVQVISTYIFWNHHEEVQGQFDWTGRRDLREFIQLCAKHRIYVFLRIGPWVHGEARYGGLPDWVVQATKKIRTNDPVYLQYVGLFFNQIGKQTEGLLWKDGGPVIGVQLENEYGMAGPGAGVEHIQKLKELAVQAGLVVPIYSVTGWPSFRFPPKEEIPMLGGYPDGFWVSSLQDQAPKEVYLFRFNRFTGDMGAMGHVSPADAPADPRHYPFGEAEAGAGMQVAYHRRPWIRTGDITALTLTGLGSGVNFYGYFMFQGGSNPEGKITSLQESQKTGYPNDLPHVSYDFEAPLGEFGQERESYRELKSLNLFLNAFGSELAPMAPIGPSVQPKSPADTSVARAAVRSKDGRGFLFVNNYVRQLAMPGRKHFQATIRIAGGVISLPAEPLDVPPDSYFIWPFNLPLSGATLRYSTAQLITTLDVAGTPTYFFFAVPGIAPEFDFDARDTSVVEATRRMGAANGLRLRVVPGKDSTIEVTAKDGQTSRIIVLTKDEADHFWKIQLHGEQDALLTTAAVLVKDDRLYLRSTEAGPIKAAFFDGKKDGPKLNADGNLATQVSDEGLWTNYSVNVPMKSLAYTWKKTAEAGAAPTPKMGTARNGRDQVVEVPDDAAFAKAAEWTFKLPKQNLAHMSEIYLSLNYVGDIGRASITGHLIDDNFFNGMPWEIGLKRFLPELDKSPMEVKVLPLKVDAPIYLDKQARKELPATGQVAQILSVSVTPEYEVVLR